MRGAFFAVLLMTAASSAHGQDAVITGGSGVLTMCRSWFFFNSCQDYNHVAVPTRVVVGDSLTLIFGSNTKKISFPVARIARRGDRCTIYNEIDGGDVDVDKLELESCKKIAP